MPSPLHRITPRLRVIVGPSVDDFAPIDVNSSISVKIKTDAFEGEVPIFIKDPQGPKTGIVRDTDYFRKRSGVTWGIQFQGTFKRWREARECGVTLRLFTHISQEAASY